MEIVGKRFAKGKYFLLELMMAGKMMKQISGTIKPLLKRRPEKGRLVAARLMKKCDNTELLMSPV